MTSRNFKTACFRCRSSNLHPPHARCCLVRGARPQQRLYVISELSTKDSERIWCQYSTKKQVFRAHYMATNGFYWCARLSIGWIVRASTESLPFTRLDQVWSIEPTRFSGIKRAAEEWYESTPTCESFFLVTGPHTRFRGRKCHQLFLLSSIGSQPLQALSAFSIIRSTCLVLNSTSGCCPKFAGPRVNHFPKSSVPAAFHGSLCLIMVTLDDHFSSAQKFSHHLQVESLL